ncbi:MAG TPA: ComEC/Rec2 family competence protein [Pirellulales bacterium]
MTARRDNRNVRATTGYQPLVVVAVAVCAGIVVDHLLPARWTAWWLAAIVLWGAWLAAWRQARLRIAGIMMLACLAATGAAWHQVRWALYPNDELGTFALDTAQPVCLEAIARSSPRRMPAPEFDPMRPVTSGDRSRLTVHLLRIRDGDRWLRASGTATLDVDGHLLGIQAGDHLQVFGQLRAISAPANPGEFDFADYERVDRRLGRLSADHPECVTVLAPGSLWQPRRWWDKARLAGDNALWNSLGRTHSGLALALILGQREQLDAAATRHYYETGTVHLLSISGLHVGLLALVLFRGLEFGFLRRGPALAAVAIITALYALVIDAEPPAVRATVMVAIVCAALYAGRPSSMFNLLGAAAVIVMAWNPAEVFRAGTQLSFLAVATMAWLGPHAWKRPALDPLDRLIARTRPWPQRIATSLGAGFGRMMLITTAIWLISLPLVLARFNLISPGSLLLTPLLAVPVALGLFTGFVLVSVGWLIWPLSIPLGMLCDTCMAIVGNSVRIVDRLPGSHVWLPGPPTWWLVGCYGLIATWAVDARLRPPRRWCAALLAGWIAVGFFASQGARPQRDELECAFLSVGHGCAVVMSLPDGSTVLYDAGQLGSPTAAARSISGYLWSRGRRHIDAVVISHADIDHYNALPELLRRFSVGAVYVSPVMFDDGGAGVAALRDAIEEADVPLREISAGDRLRGSNECSLNVLHPPARGALGSDNANSIVLEVIYRGRRLLLPGDLESPGLDDLLAESPLDCDLVLAPHHGSAQSDPPGFVAWTTPEFTVISGDSRSNRPEVAGAYRRHGAQVFNTSLLGSIMVTIDARNLRISSWRDEPSRMPVVPWPPDEGEQ